MSCYRFQIITFLFSFLSLSVSAVAPVAKWDVVPNQRFTGVFNVGVIAFHELPVKVEFFVNGELAYQTTELKMNERTGVEEYYFPIDSSKYGDREIKVTAKASVSDNDEVMLPEIILYSNDTKKHGSKKIVWVDSKEGIDYSEGSETAPVRTLKIAVKKCGDGGVVYCKKGVYSAKRIGGGFSRKYWTTITAAPGLKIGEVKIQGGRPATDFLKFKDVDIFIDVEGDYDMVVGGEGSSKSSRAWFDNCRLYNKKGRNAAETSPFGNKLTAYVTGGLTGLLKNGPINATLIRNHKVRQIVSEAFSGNDMLVVNSSVEDVLPGIDETAKPSLFAGCAITPQWLENIIFYNVTAKSLEGNGIIAGRIRNSAFVNVMIEGTAKNGFSRFTDKVENVYIKNLSQRNLEWDWHLGDIKKAGALRPVNVRAYSLGVKKMYGYTAYDGSCGILVEQEGVVENDVY